MQITKEQLRERARGKVKSLEFAITQSAFTAIREGLEEELELARIALSAMDAEPVAYAAPQALINFKSDEGMITVRTREWMWRRPGEDLIPLYAAPPAPVVPTFEQWLESSGQRPLGWVKDVMREAYDACRAAMLQSCVNTGQIDPVSQPYKLTAGGSDE
ncbi:hypothetical protein ACEU8V_000015 [Escherichia coli]|nr:hypothetical protein [Escherichia coli]